jgi:AraC-like DNA-binding protein
LQQTAARFNYSPEHLSRKFRNEVGISYRSYCEQVRMRRAIALLSDEAADLSVIAETLGYSDSSCFIRAFRQVYGITPGAYRKRRRSLDE